MTNSCRYISQVTDTSERNTLAPNAMLYNSVASTAATYIPAPATGSDNSTAPFGSSRDQATCPPVHSVAHYPVQRTVCTSVPAPLPMQSASNFMQEVNSLLYKRPLVIHTRILPPGVQPNDPRLADARITSERRYFTDKPVIPFPMFTATFHPALLSNASAPPNRLVVSE